MTIIYNVATGMTWCCQYFQVEVHVSKVDSFSILHRLGKGGDVLSGRAIDRHRVVVQDIRHTAHVIGMVVCAEDGRWYELLLFQEYQDRVRIAGVHDRDVTGMLRGPAADQPDVVVLESADV